MICVRLLSYLLYYIIDIPQSSINNFVDLSCLINKILLQSCYRPTFFVLVFMGFPN